MLSYYYQNRIIVMLYFTNIEGRHTRPFQSLFRNKMNNTVFFFDITTMYAW